MWGAALGQVGLDPTAVEVIAVGLRIVSAITLNRVGLAPRTTRTSTQGRDGVDQRQQLGDVMPVGGRQDRDERNAARLGEDVVFGTRLAAIGWVRSSFFPPRSARSEALSTIARARSSWPCRRSSASSTVCRRFQTPARCHCTSRRQQVLPDPHPISFGSICHGRPARKTNTMPVNAARSGTRGRPRRLPARRRRFGSSGAIRAHRASSMRRWDMRDRLALGHATVPTCRSKYKRDVSHF